VGGKADQPWNDEHLFLSRDGLSVGKSKGLAGTITRALEERARAANASLKDGEAPIHLPTGWGTTGSYVFRFLWGHRAIEQGASMSSVALALGNTERTTRQYYHKVKSDTAINAVPGRPETTGGRRIARPHRMAPRNEDRPDPARPMLVLLPRRFLRTRSTVASDCGGYQGQSGQMSRSAASGRTTRIDPRPMLSGAASSISASSP
jgi:hypothetical protein